MDVVSRCIFGLEIDSLGNENDPFLEHAQHFFHSPDNKSPAVVLPAMYPNFFNLDHVFVTKHVRFFMDLLDDIIRERYEAPQKFENFIEFAIKAFADVKKEGAMNQPMWTKEQIDEMVMGQATLFLLAGFDTMATTLSNACYLLAKNPEIQEKLYDAIMARHDEFVKHY